jgi:hypothetical protein
MIATAVITAPRPKSTLESSLVSYRYDGLFDNKVHVFADGEVQPFRSDFLRGWEGEIILNPRKLGNLRNWWGAFTWLMQHTDSPWLMICEDDITWSDNAKAKLEHDLRHWDSVKTGVLSLYLPQRMSKILEPTYSQGSRLSNGWYGVSMGRKLWGAQCFVIPRAEGEALMACGYLAATLSDATKHMNVDAHVAESVVLRGHKIWYRVPCLVDHILGDLNSSLYGNKDRPDLRTRYFEGNR